MKRKNVVISALLAGLMLLSACGSKNAGNNKNAEGADTASADTKVLKLAFNQSENHPQFKTLEEMSEEFYEKTDGAYKIEPSPNELLGSQKDSFESVQNGTIQMAMVANSIAENVNPDFAVLGLPYVYDDIEHQKKVFTSGVLDDVFNSTSDNKFNVLAAFTAGARCVYTDKPIKEPADLKGYKIRVMESPTSIDMLNAMGGVATPMAQGEVYTAIQQKVINGGENNEITYSDLKHYEVSPYFSYTKHLMIPDLLVINSDLLEGMSEEHQEILHELSKKYTDREFELWNEQIDSAKQAAIDAGTTFVEDVDVEAFREACDPVVEKVTSKSESSKKLYDEIRELAK